MRDYKDLDELAELTTMMLYDMAILFAYDYRTTRFLITKFKTESLWDTLTVHSHGHVNAMNFLMSYKQVAKRLKKLGYDCTVVDFNFRTPEELD